MTYTIDWNAAGVWAQVFLLAAAAFIALRQLQSFNENERTKNTLEHMRRFLSDSYTTFTGVQKRPNDAMRFVANTTWGKALAELSRYNSGAVVGDKTAVVNTLRDFGDCTVILYDYFDAAAELLQRKALDRSPVSFTIRRRYRRDTHEHAGRIWNRI